MKDKRKELFDRWRLLENKINNLSAVVRNEVEFLTDKDIDKFDRDFTELRVKLERLGDDTRKYINLKRDNYNPKDRPYEDYVDDIVNGGEDK
jgi:hypothetical protein